MYERIKFNCYDRPNDVSLSLSMPKFIAVHSVYRSWRMTLVRLGEPVGAFVMLLDGSAGRYGPVSLRAGYSPVDRRRKILDSATV